MVQYNDLLRQLRQDYPQLRFVSGERFAYRPSRTIVYEQISLYSQKVTQSGVLGIDSSEQKNKSLQLLHELGHALLQHRDYVVDIERLRMERAAWDKAQELCRYYQVKYDEDLAEAELDTYRDWLHRRSLCKKCGLTRYQAPDGRYHCPHCENFGCSSKS